MIPRPASWPSPLRWVTVWFLTILATGAVAMWRLDVAHKDDVRRACERGNVFRTEDLPQAFDTFGRFLGAELDASQERIDDAMRRFHVVLAGQLPPRVC